MGEYQPNRSIHWQKVLSAFLTSRWPGLLVAVMAIFWRAGWEVNGLFSSGVMGAAIVFAMLHTQAGRRWLFLGWLTTIAIFVLNLVYIEFEWDALLVLFFVLAVGASWFVDWHRVMGRLQNNWRRTTPPPNEPVR